MSITATEFAQQVWTKIDPSVQLTQLPTFNKRQRLHVLTTLRDVDHKVWQLAREHGLRCRRTQFGRFHLTFVVTGFRQEGDHHADPS